MENKYNELEKLNQLKANGTITDAEFEVEKHKILNNIKKNRRLKKSKILFIVTIIFIIITIGLFFYKNSCKQKEHDYLSNHMTDDISLKYKKINQYEYDQIQKQKSELWKSRTTSENIFFVSCGITIVFLVSGIVVFIVEKKKKI